MNPQHLKGKEKDISRTKNYCITICNQKTSSIHTFILEIQQILGSHELKTMAVLDHTYPKIIESTFSFPEFVPACKKSLYFICSFLKYYLILESHDQTGHIDLWPCPLKKYFDQLLIFVNLYQHAKSVILSVHSSDTVNFRVSSPDLPHTFFDQAYAKNFKHLFI